MKNWRQQTWLKRNPFINRDEQNIVSEQFKKKTREGERGIKGERERERLMTFQKYKTIGQLRVQQLCKRKIFS